MKKIIAINAGHHNTDPGYTRQINGVLRTEAEEVKKIRDEVKRLISVLDIETHFVPDELTLSESTKWVNKQMPTSNDGIAIDIHLNANGNSKASGAEVYNSGKTTTQNYSKILSKHLAKELDIPDRGERNQNVSYVGSLGWINNIKVPSVVIEVCFMSCDSDWNKLQDNGHTKAAKAIIYAICEIMNLSAPTWDTPVTPEKEEVVVLKKTTLQKLIDLFKSVVKKYVLSEESRSFLLSRKNVVGVGLNKDVAVVLVSTKEELTFLDARDIIPDTIDGLKTKVIEIGDVTTMAQHTTKSRPVQGGSSAVHYAGTACTLGAIVYKDNQAYALQNTHCAYPHWNGAKIGDDILQPSPMDGGKRDDIIGQVTEVTKISLDGVTLNYFDSSLVKLSVPERELYQENLGVIKSIPAKVKIGDVVKKSGRTTGFQTSKVIATDVTIDVTFQDKKGKTCIGRFANQILAENKDGYFTSGGDSSSLVVNSNNQPVGQISAGSNTIAVFAPIQVIMDRYGFTFSKTESDKYVCLGKVGSEYAKIDISSVKEGNRAIVNTNLNVRPSAGTTDSPLMTLSKGDVITIGDTIVDKSGAIWVKIK